jgi:hypothetical protein
MARRPPTGTNAPPKNPSDETDLTRAVRTIAREVALEVFAEVSAREPELPLFSDSPGEQPIRPRRRPPGRVPAATPETSEVVTKTDHVAPPLAMDEHVDGPQTARGKWALERIHNWHKLGVGALTRKINEALFSEEGRKAGKYIGKPLSDETVGRIRKSFGRIT